MIPAPILAMFTSAKLWAYVALAAAVAFALWSAYSWAYDRGELASDTRWQQRYDKEQRDWHAATLLAEQRARTAEWQGQQRLAALTADYTDKERKHEKTISSLRARIAAGERLRDPYPVDRPTGGSDTGALADSTCSVAAEGGGELSRQATEFLSSEAVRADGIVIKYNLCVDALAAYIDFYGGGHGWRLD